MRYDVARPELDAFVPQSTRRLLDVGCSAGSVARMLRERIVGIEVWGVEPNPSSARIARDHLDHLVEMKWPEARTALPPGQFDVVMFNDVLEHMFDPWAALQPCRDLLSDNGVIIASIPNIRHISVVWPLVRRGRWDYTEVGLLDRTHLRFFTRRSITSLFQDTGWSIVEMAGINRRLNVADVGERRKLRAIRKLVGARLDEFFYVQYVVVARPTITEQ